MARTLAHPSHPRPLDFAATPARNRTTELTTTAPTLARSIARLHELLVEANRARAAALLVSLRTTVASVQSIRGAQEKRATDRIGELLRCHDEAVRARQELHASTSPMLNCWAILGLEQSEVQHSRVLAWLLDRRGSHAQGSLFLQHICTEILSGNTLPDSCFRENYRVRTEVAHERSRIDIEVLSKTFVIHFEVKVTAREGEAQTDRERHDLQQKATSLSIPAERVFGVYLTRDGSPCGDRSVFAPVGWKRIVRAVTRAADHIRSSCRDNVYLPWVLDKYVETIDVRVLRGRFQED